MVLSSSRHQTLWIIIAYLCNSGNGLSTTPAKLETKARPPPFSFLHRVDRFLDSLQNPEEQLRDHIYLFGNYAPVTKEHVQAPVTVVEGAIPRDIDGMFVRNGPNPVPHRLSKRYHWFDGHAMLHMLRFENGDAWYSNQFVPCPRYLQEEERDEEVFPHIGEYLGFVGLIKVLMHPTMVRKKIPDLKTVLPPNTACLLYKDSFYCLNEGNLPFSCRIHPDGRLEGLGFESFNDQLDFPVSAHPCIDRNGDLLFHSYTTNTDLIAEHGPIKVGRMDKTGKLVSYFGIKEMDYVSFAHSLTHSEDYMIIFDTSVHFTTNGIIDGKFFKTQKNYNLRIGVIPKTGTSAADVRWFDTGIPGAIVHPLNAWQEGNEIVLWTPLCDNLIIDLDSNDINRFNMVEIRLNTEDGSIQKQTIDTSVNVEFSVVQQVGSFTKYGYTAIQDPSTPGEGSFSGFCTWDMESSKLDSTVYFEKGEVGGEPMLIPRPGGRVYVGVYTHRLETNDSYFLLFEGDGSNKLVTRLKMPARVPFGFHGSWLEGQDLRSHWARFEKEETGVTR